MTGVVRPVILAVDDDPSALAGLELALRARYDRDYDVRCHASPAAALHELGALRDSGHPVAIVLAAQWLAEMEGIELLPRAHLLHPTAKRILLITWGDRSSAEPILRAMAVGAFDYYAPKPAAPRDEEFHVVVQGFLASWARTAGTGFAPAAIVGDPESPRVRELRDLVARNGILARLIDPASPEGLAVRSGMHAGAADLPLVVVVGTVLENPTNAQVADAFGVNTEALDRRFDVIIVGAGPAGLGAAVYAASEGLATLVVEREAIGGQAGSSSLIRNYLGFPVGIGGSDLAIRAYEQAWLFGAAFQVMRHATQLESDGEDLVVVLSDGRRVRGRAVILASGVAYRRLGLPDLEALVGTGVFYGATVSEAPSMVGRRVFVAGAGNSAGQAALHLADYAASVTIIARGSGLAQTMSDYLVREIEATPGIAVRTGMEVVGGGGAGHLERLLLRDVATGTTEGTPADALFVLIGAEPRTDWLPPAIQRDDRGYIRTGADLEPADLGRAGWPLERSPRLLETSVPGVFAAGDVRHRSVKRVASAVGEGAIAVTLVHDHLAMR